MADWCIDGIACPHGRIDPGGRKWVITYQRAHCDYHYFDWECDTDVPICLFAYLGERPAWKKRGTHLKRGVVYHHDPELMCRYKQVICQNEHEETTHHTFHWEIPTPLKPFFWRCGGQTLGAFGRWSASRSPCFSGLCETPPFLPMCRTLTPREGWSTMTNGYEGAWTVTPTVQYTNYQTTLWLASQAAHGSHPMHIFRIYSGRVGIVPIEPPLREIWKRTQYLPDGEPVPVTFNYPSLVMNPGQEYIFSLTPWPYAWSPDRHTTNWKDGYNSICPPHWGISYRWWREGGPPLPWTPGGWYAHYLTDGIL